jgi:hypothetical protein
VTWIEGYLTPHLVSARDVNSVNRTKTGITVFPNPAISTINFRSDGIERNGRYQIIDFTGRTIQKGDFQESSGTNQINIQQLSPGGYILSLTQNGRCLRGMFLKQ